jgi:hypothetical protein
MRTSDIKSWLLVWASVEAGLYIGHFIRSNYYLRINQCGLDRSMEIVAKIWNMPFKDALAVIFYMLILHPMIYLISVIPIFLVLFLILRVDEWDYCHPWILLLWPLAGVIAGYKNWDKPGLFILDN